MGHSFKDIESLKERFKEATDKLMASGLLKAGNFILKTPVTPEAKSKYPDGFMIQQSDRTDASLLKNAEGQAYWHKSTGEIIQVDTQAEGYKQDA
jgi:hypothetical protein